MPLVLIEAAVDRQQIRDTQHDIGARDGQASFFDASIKL
jgi:hypothetical protein